MPFPSRMPIGFRRLARLACLARLALCLAMPAMQSAMPVWASGDEDDWGSTSAEAAQEPLSSRTSRKVLALKEEANRYYRARKSPEACRIYREASLLDSNDAGLRNDLGICFLKS